jgi:DNA-binding beta-propeller fold protein YncE
MMKQASTLALLICICLFAFGKNPKHKHSKDKDKESAAYHSPYDDSTLLVRAGPILMPYNRYIDPAGTAVSFGNADKECHALDCIMLPDGKTLAVEERFGLAFIDVENKKLKSYLEFGAYKDYKNMRSTYSGIKTIQRDGMTHLYWSAADGDHRSLVIDAIWNGNQAKISDTFSFEPFPPAPLALPNDLLIHSEDGENFLYVLLNGNNQLVKIRLRDKQVIWTIPVGMAPYGIAIVGTKAYVTNWAGPYPNNPDKETAGIPYGKVYIDHRTGGTLPGTVSVIDIKTPRTIKEISVGLHPNAIIASTNGSAVYVANGNSDEISVISTTTDEVVQTLSVRLNAAQNPFVGDAPNALAIDPTGTTLYVANGMDNAVAVVSLNGTAKVKGFIPTEAYPAGLALNGANLYVCNLEGEGARVKEKESYNSHHQSATVSIIPVPKDDELPALTKRVEDANMQFRAKLSQLLPRTNAKPKAVPDRIGEPSTIKHVIYVIKENRTYDQVMGDMKEGDGMKSICIFGDSVTPNQHRIARDFLLLDNYYASGKSSAEGHQWADAAMTSDYIEKSVRAWFRSYPHVQNDALVENKEGFIWNDALDHGKSVRIFGEACIPNWEGKHDWKDMYELYKSKKPFVFNNTTTISRVRPIMSNEYPCGDVIEISDQFRADAFIKELKETESKPGDNWPQLMIVALPNDHTAGTNPKFPMPESMVADNDLALGRIIDAVTHSRFWDSTAIFVTEDDSQNGWDHVSAYRTTGFVISPYSHLKHTVHTNYNQTCMVRTIEQILGIPPMNTIDATALPMFDCFGDKPDATSYTFVPNTIPLDRMNTPESKLHGQELHYERESVGPQFAHVDAGDDDLLNHILWFHAMGNKPYPKHMTLPKKERKKDDD